MIKKLSKNSIRKRKHVRVRNKISGTAERPRLCVFRSSRHIYAQLIDDVNGVTLAHASTLDADLKSEDSEAVKTDIAKKVGELIAKRALEKEIENVVFDRGGYIYHGRIAALADGAREAGLKF